MPQAAPICMQCSNAIKPITSLTLKLTQKKSMPVRAVGAYENPLKTIILSKNYHNRTASSLIGTLMADHLHQRPITFDVIVPVPLHWTRYAYRGFNQAEVIAEEISLATGKPIINALKRIKRTVFQSRLSANERHENVRSVFEVTGTQNLQGAHILLVDDIVTTGATLTQAGKKLLECNPASITAFVAARAI